MYNEILKKKGILDSRKPYDIEVRKKLKQEEACALISTALHLEGSIITKQQVEEILDGGFIRAATLQDHLSIEHHIEALAHIDNLLDMENDLNLRIMEEINDILCSTEGQIWRKSNPIVYTLDYMPEHYQEVREKVEELMRWFYRCDEEVQGNVLLKAALLHNKLIEIYPFEYFNEATARLLMYYVLMQAGLPICELRVSEQEYNSAIVEYLKKHNIEPFYRILERNMYNRLDVILQMTEEDEF